jgi:ABC-type transport system substrate-binding protein
LPRWNGQKQWFELQITPGTRFHNGRLATAHDLEFSLVRFFLTTGRADQRAVLREIDGVDQVEPGQQFRSRLSRGIVPLSADRLAIRLRYPRPDFFFNLIDGWISLVPFEELQPDYVTWKTIPVGAGPYKVESVDPDAASVRISLVDQPQGSAPKVVDFISDPSRGDADVVVFQPLTNSHLATTAIMGGPIGYTGIFFNPNSDLARDERFRRAVALCVKRPVFNNPLHGFVPLYEVLTSNFKERLGIVATTNLEEARNLAGALAIPKSDTTLSIPVHFGTRPLTEEERFVLESLRADLKGLGLMVEFVPATSLTFGKGDSTTPFRLDRRGSAFHDPMVHLSAFASGGLLSAFYPADLAAYTQLVEHVSQATDVTSRSTRIRSLSKLFYDKVLVVPLYEDRKVYWINPKVITSLGRQDSLGLDLAELCAGAR